MWEPGMVNERPSDDPKRGCHATAVFIIALAMFIGCGSAYNEPVDIYAEDMCSHCRMAISDERYACELLVEQDQVFKFDDIGCMETFRRGHRDLIVRATFYKGYDSKHWIPEDRAVIVETAIMTPMGSGKIAVTDTTRAKALAESKAHQ